MSELKEATRLNSQSCGFHYTKALIISGGYAIARHRTHQANGPTIDPET